MLRPANTSSLRRLRRAATSSDAELDMALLGLGVLAPVDLDEIRECLRWPGTTLKPMRNTDGHRVIGVYADGRAAAWIHHDGRVVPTPAQHLLVGA